MFLHRIIRNSRESHVIMRKRSPRSGAQAHNCRNCAIRPDSPLHFVANYVFVANCAFVQGSTGVSVGSRLHTGRWNTSNPGYGTVMRINMDVTQKEIASYDVLMESGDGIETVVAHQVEADVLFARTYGAPASSRLPAGGTSAEYEVSEEGGISNAEDDSEASDDSNSYPALSNDELNEDRGASDGRGSSNDENNSAAESASGQKGSGGSDANDEVESGEEGSGDEKRGAVGTTASKRGCDSDSESTEGSRPDSSSVSKGSDTSSPTRERRRMRRRRNRHRRKVCRRGLVRCLDNEYGRGG